MQLNKEKQDDSPRENLKQNKVKNLVCAVGLSVMMVLGGCSIVKKSYNNLVKEPFPAKINYCQRDGNKLLCEENLINTLKEENKHLVFIVGWHGSGRTKIYEHIKNNHKEYVAHLEDKIDIQSIQKNYNKLKSSIDADSSLEGIILKTIIEFYKDNKLIYIDDYKLSLNHLSEKEINSINKLLSDKNIVMIIASSQDKMNDVLLYKYNSTYHLMPSTEFDPPKELSEDQKKHIMSGFIKEKEYLFKQMSATMIKDVGKKANPVLKDNITHSNAEQLYKNIIYQLNVDKKINNCKVPSYEAFISTIAKIDGEDIGYILTRPNLFESVIKSICDSTISFGHPSVNIYTVLYDYLKYKLDGNINIANKILGNPLSSTIDNKNLTEIEKDIIENIFGNIKIENGRISFVDQIHLNSFILASQMANQFLETQITIQQPQNITIQELIIHNMIHITDPWIPNETFLNKYLPKFFNRDYKYGQLPAEEQETGEKLIFYKKIVSDIFNEYLKTLGDKTDSKKGTLLKNEVHYKPFETDFNRILSSYHLEAIILNP